MPAIFRYYCTLAAASLLLGLGWTQLLHPVAKPERFLMQSYRQLIGPLDGRNCPAYPVCSLYASEALEKHGLLVGSWLMIDRLIHEHDDLGRGPWLTVAGETRLYDPLERNDFWLHQNNNKARKP